MASRTRCIVDQMRRAIGVAAVVSLSSLARKVLLAAVAAALVVLLTSQWPATLSAADGFIGHRHVIMPLRLQRPIPTPRRSSALAPANSYAPVTCLSQSKPGVLRGATDASSCVSPPPPAPRRRLVLLWTAFWGRSFEDYMKRSFPPCQRCDQLCELTYDRKRESEADALLFHAADLGSQVPDVRRAAQLWVLFNLEPPSFGFVSSAHDGLFNLTMMYRSDSDVEVGYGRTEAIVATAAANCSSPATPSSRTSSLAADFAERKPYAYWMVSDCADPRMAYVRELAKHIRVDVFGKCAPLGSPKCSGSPDATDESPCEAKLSATYTFYLAFENSLCTDYVTEKLWRTLASPGGAIPVVIGAPPSRYAHVAPPGSFVHAESFASPRDLAVHLKRVASSRQLFASYHQWRARYRVYVGWYYELARGLCRLCELMHSEEGRSKPAKADLFRWFSSGCAAVWPVSG